MKLKKILAGIAATAVAVAAIPAVSASAVTAGATSVDFEDGDCSFVYMNDLDGGSKATISVADFDGSKQLKVSPSNGDLYSKIWFDLDTIMDREKAVEIGSIELDITIAPDSDDGVVGSWIGGEMGSAGGFDKTGANIQASQANPGWSNSSWDVTIEYDDLGAPKAGASAKGHATKRFLLPTQKYSMDGTNPFFCVMVNGGQTDGRVGTYSIYIDNIVFKTSDGSAIAVGVSAAAETEAEPEETTAAVEETTAAPETEAADDDDVADVDDDEDIDDIDVDEDVDDEVAAPVETEAAPVVTEAPATTAAPVAASTAPATGNVAVASIVAVMAAAGAAALVSKKRK